MYRNSSDLAWSQSVRDRRGALGYDETESSEENKSQCPPPDSLLPNLPHENEVAKKYSSCSCRKSSLSIEKPNSSSLNQSRTTGKKHSEKKHSLQQLEVKLYNATLEEATQSDRLEKTQEKLRRAAQLLEAQVLYLQSLDLKTRALARLTHLTGNLAYNDLAPSDTLAQTLNKITWDPNLLEDLNKVQQTVTASLEAPEQLYQLLEEFRDKQKDFNSATNTFSLYLRNARKVSSSQLRKFEGQYDSIKGSCEGSRQNLDLELPKLIHEKYEVLLDCFSKLLPVQETLLEQDRQFLVLSKEIANSLLDPTKKHVCRRSRCGEKNCESKGSRRN